MPATAAQEEDVVQFGGRIPASLRKRVRMAAVAQDVNVQDLLQTALEEYLTRRNF